MKMTPEIAERLPVLNDLPHETVHVLLSSAKVRRYPPRTKLFEQGEYADHLNVLLSGAVELFTAFNSREFGIMGMRPGDVFLPAAVLFNEPYLVSARSLAITRVLQLDAGLVRELFATSPIFASAISKALTGHFRMAVRHILDLKCRGPAERLASFLLRLADQDDGLSELPMSKRQVATRLGMTPETLSRALKTIGENGLTLSGRKIEVRDRDLIVSFCGEPPYCTEDDKDLNVHIL